MTGNKTPTRRRIPAGSSTFIRLLCELNDVHPAEPGDGFAQRLSRWFAWTDAIALAGALPGAGTGLAADAGPGPLLFVATEEHEATRVRHALERLAEPAPAPRPPGPGRRLAPVAQPAPEPQDDFATHRRRYVAAQQTMEARVTALRRRLRATLETGPPALARLAALDAVMEQVLGEREYELLASVPSWLERSFERLRRAAAAEPATAAPGAPLAQAAWLDVFSRSMRGVMLAELDLRLQPVEGLLEALRSSTDRHE